MAYTISDVRGSKSPFVQTEKKETAPAATQTELVPIEGYGASEVRFGWAVSGAAIAAAGLLGWYLFASKKNGKRRKGRKRLR